MKFTIDARFARIFTIYRLLADFVFSMARAIAVYAAFLFVYQSSHDPVLGVFNWVLKTAIMVYGFSWPISTVVEVGKLFPAVSDGKYDAPAWVFGLIVVVALALNVGTLMAITNLPGVLAPLSKS